jgi:hypothetical protein
MKIVKELPDSFLVQLINEVDYGFYVVEKDYDPQIFIVGFKEAEYLEKHSIAYHEANNGKTAFFEIAIPVKNKILKTQILTELGKQVPFFEPVLTYINL